MTTRTSSPRSASATRAASTRLPLLAGLAIGVAAVLTAIGTFYDNEETGHTLSEWLIVLGIIAVGAAVVFGLVVRTAPTGDPARRSLVLAVVALVSGLVFWTGLPVVLAVGAIACALVARDVRGRFDTIPAVAVALSALVIVAVAVLAFTG
jgi:predicted membrane protein